MSLAGVRYRLGQVASLLRSRQSPPDPAPARSVLPEPLFRLFLGMPAEDRRHALRVLADLRARGHGAPELLQAGLLHDVGKAQAGVGLPHRVARALLRPAFPGLWRWLSGWPTGWRRPFWAVAHHPKRGAVWVETEGATPEVALLIRHHESPAPAEWAGTDLAAWHAALAWADARS